MPVDLAGIAQEWACSERTARRWKAQGAPLSNPARLRVWLAGRKNLPQATRAKLAGEARTRRAHVAAEADIDASEIGAPAALRRLEASEATAYRLLQSGIAAGDPLEIKLARESWLKIGDSLRRYDLLVEKSRRDAGELVPRAEVETAVARFTNWFKLACVRTASALAPPRSRGNRSRVRQPASAGPFRAGLELVRSPGREPVPREIARLVAICCCETPGKHTLRRRGGCEHPGAGSNGSR
jgi:hypothetical protein